VLVIARPGAAATPEYHLSDDPAATFEAPMPENPGFTLGNAALSPTEDAPPPAAVADPPQRLDLPPILAPDSRRATVITAGILLGASAMALSGGWTDGYFPFHAGQEDWFGRHTYSGGADKASHFVLYNGLSRELHIGYERMGYSDDSAFKMALGTSLAAGLITEIGNAFGEGPGFSYEDLVMDALGAGTAVFMTRHGLDDVAGFRFGLVPAPKPQPCCPYDEIGKDYSNEIYTADLKLAGIAQRLHVRPGLARWLLASFTYGTKGYKFSEPGYREQQVGFEVGINFPEILTALGVRQSTWWGRTLFIFFDFIRIPYTQIGVRYDVIHGSWYGPNVGEQYDPGPGALMAGRR